MHIPHFEHHRYQNLTFTPNRHQLHLPPSIKSSHCKLKNRGTSNYSVTPLRFSETYTKCENTVLEDNHFEVHSTKLFFFSFWKRRFRFDILLPLLPFFLLRGELRRFSWP
ncbi:hypothetical protein NPIL_250081 [Nephila pilipes]|uniref:Uncharacterized protein n=1 Tax=Nephila pilipes TaxID=299642 RepID=A0A8X6TJ95_NEPPI|nr:hypothetical protein NPIL_250081 [Nephila pilipes]